MLSAPLIRAGLLPLDCSFRSGEDLRLGSSQLIDPGRLLAYNLRLLADQCFQPLYVCKLDLLHDSFLLVPDLTIAFQLCGWGQMHLASACVAFALVCWGTTHI